MKKSVTVYQMIDLKTQNNETVLNGTIKDIRIWAKNRWKENSDYIRGLMIDLGGILNEEDFYYLMDGTVTLSNFLHDIGCGLIIVCEVSLEDFQE